MSSDGLSVSSISTTPATTGCHMLKIEGYSQTKRIPTGSHATSSEFEAAGQTWFILYYPNGNKSASADHISLYINLARSVDDTTIYAKIRFSVVPHNGNPAPLTQYCKSFFIASSKQLLATGGFGYTRFVKREVLEKSEYLLDDCFAVRVDIDVVKVTTAVDQIVNAKDLERLGWPCSCEDDLCKRLHPGRSVEPASPSIESPTVKKASAPTTPALSQRRRGVRAAWSRLTGRGQI